MLIPDRPYRGLGTEAPKISDADLTLFRDALSKCVSAVDVISDPAAATGYDGVIVVRWDTSTNRFLVRSERTVLPAQGRVTETIRPDLPQARTASQPLVGKPYDTNEPGIALYYDVVRNGKPDRSGLVRVPILPNATPEQLEQEHDRYARAADAFARDVARQLRR